MGLMYSYIFLKYSSELLSFSLHFGYDLVGSILSDRTWNARSTLILFGGNTVQEASWLLVSLCLGFYALHKLVWSQQYHLQRKVQERSA
jgi:hypothetical protein